MLKVYLIWQTDLNSMNNFTHKAIKTCKLLIIRYV